MTKTTNPNATTTNKADLAFQAILAREEEAHKHYERTTFYKDYTILQLRWALENVCDPKDWKAPWAKMVPCDQVPITIVAVEFFHADRPTAGEFNGDASMIRLIGKGYQA